MKILVDSCAAAGPLPDLKTAKDFIEIDQRSQNVFSNKVGLSCRRPVVSQRCKNLCFSRRPLHTLKAKLVDTATARSFVFSVTTGACLVTHLRESDLVHNAPQAGAGYSPDRHLLLNARWREIVCGEKGLRTANSSKITAFPMGRSLRCKPFWIF